MKVDHTTAGDDVSLAETRSHRMRHLLIGFRHLITHRIRKNHTFYKTCGVAVCSNMLFLVWLQINRATQKLTIKKNCCKQNTHTFTHPHTHFAMCGIDEPQVKVLVKLRFRATEGKVYAFYLYVGHQRPALSHHLQSITMCRWFMQNNIPMEFVFVCFVGGKKKTSHAVRKNTLKAITLQRIFVNCAPNRVCW